MQAVNGVAFATFVASGQTCIMGARVLVHEDIYDKFMDALVKKVRYPGQCFVDELNTYLNCSDEANQTWKSF